MTHSTDNLPADYRRFTSATLGELTVKLGIELIEISPERSVARMPVEGNRQPMGLLHGGATAALAETIGSVHGAIVAPPDRAPVGIELSCAHHRSGRQGWVTAVCTPVHVGRTLATFEIVISDDEERRISTTRLTVAFIPKVRDGSPN